MLSITNHSGHTALQMLDGINPAHLKHEETGGVHHVQGQVAVVWSIQCVKEKLAEHAARAVELACLPPTSPVAKALS